MGAWPCAALRAREVGCVSDCSSLGRRSPGLRASLLVSTAVTQIAEVQMARRGSSIIDEFVCEMDDHQLRRHWPKDDPHAWYVWRCRACGAEFASGTDWSDDDEGRP